jgi:hypothetical protein
MLRRAWILVSVVWSLFWAIIAITSVEPGQRMPEFTANVGLGLVLLPWVIGLAIHWIVAGTFPPVKD